MVQSHNPEAPAYVHRVHDGWEVCLPTGVRCHCFTPWYDECRLLADGHAELRRKTPSGVTVHRFLWSVTESTYRPVD